MKRVKYTIANWKMNGSKKSIKIIKSVANHIKNTSHKKSTVVICPPFPFLAEAIKETKTEKENHIKKS